MFPVVVCTVADDFGERGNAVGIGDWRNRLAWLRGRRRHVVAHRRVVDGLLSRDVMTHGRVVHGRLFLGLRMSHRRMIDRRWIWRHLMPHRRMVDRFDFGRRGGRWRRLPDCGLSRRRLFRRCGDGRHLHLRVVHSLRSGGKGDGR
jgi:hypothetical protein